MPFRLFRTFLNNEKTIQQLSESVPVRLAAKAIVRGMKQVEEKVEKIDVGKKLNRLKSLYEEEYQKALKKWHDPGFLSEKKSIIVELLSHCIDVYWLK